MLIGDWSVSGVGIFSLSDLEIFAVVGVRRRNLGVGTRCATTEFVLFRAIGVRELVGVLMLLFKGEGAEDFGGDLDICDRSTA